MKNGIIAYAILLGVAMASFSNGEVVRERRMPIIPHQQPDYPQQGLPLQPSYSPEEIKKMQRQQKELQRRQETQQKEREERQRQQELENWEAKRNLNDRVGFYYGGKFVMGSAKIKESSTGWGWTGWGWQDYTEGKETRVPLFGGVGTLGYRVNPLLRLELEGGFYACATGDYFHDYYYWICAGQLYADIPIKDAPLVKPYFNVGIGLQRDYWVQVVHGSVTSYNIGFGVAHTMTRNTLFDLSYRYRDTLKKPDTNKVGIYFQGSHEFLTGIRYMF